MSLTKSKLIRIIATDTGFSQKKLANIFNVMLDILTATFAKEDIISIRGFGKFYVRHHKARKIRHPATGQLQTIGPKKYVRFKCFKSLHEEINNFDFDGFKEQNAIILQQLYYLVENSSDYEDEEEPMRSVP